MKIGRFLFLGFAALLVILASQGHVQAFDLPCPAGYTGPENYQFGCCFHLNPPAPSTLAYYEYFCSDGVPEGGATMVCSTQTCTE
jgi:hypothetical protein